MAWVNYAPINQDIMGIDTNILGMGISGAYYTNFLGATHGLVIDNSSPKVLFTVSDCNCENHCDKMGTEPIVSQ